MYEKQYDIRYADHIALVDLDKYLDSLAEKCIDFLVGI